MKIILNGHKILTQDNLINFLNKKLNLELKNIEALTNFLGPETEFVVWHCDRFLSKEKNIKTILNFFAKNFDLQLSGKFKNQLEKYL